MTKAAKEFLAAVRQSWDTPGPWEDTARLGLAQPDADALRSLAEQAGESYTQAEAEVLEAIRQHVAS